MHTPSGTFTKLPLICIASICLLIGLSVAALRLRPDAGHPEIAPPRVRVYCAAGLVQPIEKIADHYNNQQHQSRVEVTRTGGSGELAGQIRAEFETNVARGADLYISADEQLMAQAQQQGIVRERFPIAQQNPVIVVTDHSPISFGDLKEMVDSEIKFGIASQRSAIGQLTRAIARRDGFLDSIENRKSVDVENVMVLAQALVTGSLDAAVLWDTTVEQVNRLHGRPVLKVVGLADQTDQLNGQVAIGVLTRSVTRSESIEFAIFLHESDFARSELEAFGFRTFKSAARNP